MINWTILIARFDIAISLFFLFQLVLLIILILCKKDITGIFPFRYFIHTPSQGTSYLGFSLIMSIPVVNLFPIAYFILVAIPYSILSCFTEVVGTFFHKRIEQNQKGGQSQVEIE